MATGVMEQINSKLDSIIQVQQGLPVQIENIQKNFEASAERIVTRAIEKHEDRCTARGNFGVVADRTADLTGKIEILRDGGKVRRSLAPAVRALGLTAVPTWVWRALGVILVAVAGKFGIDGVGQLIP